MLRVLDLNPQGCHAVDVQLTSRALPPASALPRRAPRLGRPSVLATVTLSDSMTAERWTWQGEFRAARNSALDEPGPPLYTEFVHRPSGQTGRLAIPLDPFGEPFSARGTLELVGQSHGGGGPGHGPGHAVGARRSIAARLSNERGLMIELFVPVGPPGGAGPGRDGIWWVVRNVTQRILDVD